MGIPISLTVVAAEGAPVRRSTHDVDVQPVGVPLSDVLKQCNVSTKNMQVTVDGKVVTDLGSFIVKGAKVVVEPLKVTVSERGAGS